MTPSDITALSSADFSLGHISWNLGNFALIDSFRAAEGAEGLDTAT